MNATDERAQRAFLRGPFRHGAFSSSECKAEFSRVFEAVTRGGSGGAGELTGTATLPAFKQAPPLFDYQCEVIEQFLSQWARRGVRVNALAPGWFPTEMNEEMFDDDAGRSYIEDGAPMGRGGEPHELDGALLFLASDASSFVTGHVLHVDGGWTAV